MSTPSEENAIDQSLRDVFRDYDLPPAAHPRVWEGVAGRIATLPKAGPGLPYRLLITAVLGVGVGWLLPRPAAWQPQPAAQVQVAQVLPRVAAQPTVRLASAPATSQPLSASVEGGAAMTPVPRPAALPQQPARKQRAASQAAIPTASGQPALESAAVSADSATASTAQPVSVADLAMPVALPDSAPVAAEPVAVATSPAASSQPQQAVSAHAAKPAKPAGTNEKMTYRKLSQRQPEHGTGIRRWFSHLFQSVRHLLG